MNKTSINELSTIYQSGKNEITVQLSPWFASFQRHPSTAASWTLVFVWFIMYNHLSGSFHPWKILLPHKNGSPQFHNSKTMGPRWPSWSFLFSRQVVVMVEESCSVERGDMTDTLVLLKFSRISLGIVTSRKRQSFPLFLQSFDTYRKSRVSVSEYYWHFHCRYGFQSA